MAACNRNCADVVKGSWDFLVTEKSWPSATIQHHAHLLPLPRAYDNAEQDDLWDFLTRAAHQDLTLPNDVSVKTIMDTWTLQMGYPVVKVTRSADGTSATVTQVFTFK